MQRPDGPPTTAGPYQTKSEYAYETVRAQIVSGALTPGEVVHQEVLARQLSVSITPLREALRRLQAEGLVELGPHRDARVSTLSAQEGRDILEMRRALEPYAASLAAERHTDEQMTRMRQAANELAPIPEEPGMADLEAHRRFHDLVYRAAGNALLLESLNRLWDKSDRYRWYALRSGREEGEREETSEQHEALLHCIESRDAEGAAKAALDHVDSSLGVRAAAWLEESRSAAAGNRRDHAVGRDQRERGQGRAATAAADANDA
ncbi:GntR family transcriptional regulator [Egibacter rhizosphaerae]|uniref:GntR family transcriptional regulator n=1 Tax=Egibacter rhizosphaerae TaxID=1670831 RepID=A0A411YEQ6_9ACTN|nr:GntR family transcriptional regulator [Egibacter rhizosphaerae]QBI19602.1 GntR family transcriptional regulator [Egibacter rhizosphaerae]